MPSNAEPHLACGKFLAGRWLILAEKLAELPKLARGALAGWRSSRVIRESYQHADGQRMLSIVHPTESRPKPSDSGTNEGQADAK